MTPPVRSRTILVSVDDAAGARIMRGILASLGNEYEFFFLLAHPELTELLGDNHGQPYGFDAKACILNPERFGLVITFGSKRSGGGGSAGSWLASYFEEVGVPTVEVQRDLFQEGCYPVSSEPQRSGMFQTTSGSTVLWHYAAGTLLEWGGPHGIGYPAPPADSFEVPVRSDLICVTSAFDHAAISEHERYKFTIAVIKSAMAHPELSFCWVVRLEELRNETSIPILKMVSDAALPNLWLESTEAAPSVVKRSRFGIAMPSTALLDYQREGKPVLIFACSLYEVIADACSAGPFANYFELQRLLDGMDEEYSRHSTQIAVSPFEPQKLRTQIDQALSRRGLADDWFQAASRYVARLELLAPRTQPHAAGQPESPSGAKEVSEKLNRIIERLGIIQRSTVGYKALKIMKLIKGDRSDTQ